MTMKHAMGMHNLIKKVWTSEEKFDFESKFFKTKGTYGKPKLLVHPPIFNAAGSKNGREFAVNNADFLFTPASDLGRSKTEIEELKQTGLKVNRKVNVMT